MILDSTIKPPDGAATLDDLFRRAGVRRPQAIALIDPPNREHFTGGAQRRLTYAQADRVISAIAARLRALDLPTDAVVALQLPNTVESVLSPLAILRAGMIAAPLPLLWHRADATAALRNIGAKAIVTCSRVGTTAQAEIAVQAAADVFSIRHVCAFGEGLPDGVVALDDVFTAEPRGTGAAARLADPSSHVAAVTFDVTASGLVAIARNHNQLIAGGRALYDEAGLSADAVILTTMPSSSFAGMATGLLPWLISGGTLELHHSFDAVSFSVQVHARQFDAVVLPAPTLVQLAECGLTDTARTAVAVWRAPEQMQRAETCTRPVVDVASFGEIGMVATRRETGGLPAALASGAVDVARSANGTLLLRGPMVPLSGFPLASKPPPGSNASGFVDTGYQCRFGADANTLVATAPPPGIASVGGYRFVARELDRLGDNLLADATLVALPADLTGERLAGQALDRGPVLEELARRGINPLILGAFRRPGHRSNAGVDGVLTANG
jgi:non-ribosomal peptide synthetase component E (peptide arylation enzyme)